MISIYYHQYQLTFKKYDNRPKNWNYLVELMNAMKRYRRGGEYLTRINSKSEYKLVSYTPYYDGLIPTYEIL
jgi:hypothetical protein